MNLRARIRMLQLLTVVGVILFAFGSVQAQDVTYNVAPGANFTKYKTYKWVRIDGAEYPNQIVDEQIKQSIDSQLAAKGFTKTDSDNADLEIGRASCRERV